MMRPLLRKLSEACSFYYEPLVYGSSTSRLIHCIGALQSAAASNASTPSAGTLLERRFRFDEYAALEKFRSARVKGTASIESIEQRNDGVYAYFRVEGEDAFTFVDQNRSDFVMLIKVKLFRSHFLVPASSPLRYIWYVRPSFKELVEKSIDAMVDISGHGMDVEVDADGIRIAKLAIGYSVFLYPSALKIMGSTPILQPGKPYDPAVKILTVWRDIAFRLGLRHYLGDEVDDLIVQSQSWPATWRHVEDIFLHYFFMDGPVREILKQRAASLAMAASLKKAQQSARFDISRDANKLVTEVSLKFPRYTWLGDFSGRRWPPRARRIPYYSDFTSLLRFESNFHQHIFELNSQWMVLWDHKLGLFTYFFDKEYKTGVEIYAICVKCDIELSRPN